MNRDFNQCRGCYKHQSGVCTTYPDCWFDQMKPYTDYERQSKREAAKQARAAAFLTLYRQGYTDSQIAERTEYSQPTVSKWRREAGLDPNRYAPPDRSDDVRNLRFSLGMTQAEFAARYGVSQRSVSAWESGERQPNRQVLEELRRRKNRPTELEPLTSGKEK